MEDQDKEEIERHAVTIQSSFRGYKVRKTSKEVGKESSNLEEDGHSSIADQDENDHVEEKSPEDNSELTEKIIIIQRSYRGYKVRKARKEEQGGQETSGEPAGKVTPPTFSDPHEKENFSNHHAVVIQSAYRGYVVRKDYKPGKNDDVIVQNETDEAENREKELDQQAVIIQSSYRGYKARKKYQEEKEKLQSENESADKTVDLNENAVIIQSAYRGYNARKTYNAKKREAEAQRETETNATLIQSAYRGYKSRKEYSTRVANQKADSYEEDEGHTVRIVEYPEEVDVREERIIIIQSAYRGYKIRKTIQLEESAETVQGYARGYQARKRFAQEQGENYHAQATTSAFSTDNLIEEGMYEEEEEHDGHAMATSTAQGRVSAKREMESRGTSVKREETQPKLGERKFTEYIDHSSWVARHDSKASLVKQDTNVSTVSSTLSRKRYQRKPLFMLRSATVTGGPSRGFTGFRTSKEVQVQETDFSHHGTKLDLSRMDSEASFSKMPEKSPSQQKGKLEGWNNEDTDFQGGPKLPGKDQQGPFMKYNRHQSDLNAVIEEPDEVNEEGSETNDVTGQNDVTKQPEMSQPMGTGYFNPFAFPAQSNTMGAPMTAPQFAAPMFYPYVTPYGTFFPHPMWSPFNPYPQTESPNPANQVEKKPANEKEAPKKPANQRNFVKDNKNVPKEVNKGSYKSIAAKREKLRESNEEHSAENKVEESKDDWIQTHTTVKDDNRVKVDINLNISGKQLANVLGYDEGAFSPRNAAFQPPFFPGFYHPPPFLGNVSSRTMPEIATNRKTEETEEQQSKPAKAATLAKSKKKKEEVPKIDLENSGVKNINKYPVIPPIKSDNRGKEPPRKSNDSKIPFSEKRKVEYEPHTLEDYKNLDLKPKLPASLGPDWDKIENLQVAKKRKDEYSEQLRKQHENSLATANKFPRKGYSREMMSKPEVHHEYIKTIPKPQVHQSYQD